MLYLVLVVTVLLVSFTVVVGVLGAVGVVDVTNDFLLFVPYGEPRRLASLALSVLPLMIFLGTYQRHSAHPFRWYELPAAALAFTLYGYVWLWVSATGAGQPRAPPQQLGEDPAPGRRRLLSYSPDGTVAAITVPSARRVPAGFSGSPSSRGPWCFSGTTTGCVGADHDLLVAHRECQLAGAVLDGEVELVGPDGRPAPGCRAA